MTYILDINQDQFVNEVIEKSKTIPVIVDFWAPWCGPCKQLTPVLEKLVNEENGKIVLIKINVDENQGIAGQLNIQSIPTVYGFVDGKPIDAFQGAQPESKIREMINKLIDATPGNEVPKLIEQANSLFKDQKFEEAQSIYENIITLDPGNAKIIVGILRCLSQLNKIDDAIEVLESLDEATLQDDEIQKVQKLINNQVNSKNGPSIDELEKNLINDPSNKEIRLELSQKYFLQNEQEKAFNELLFLLEKDPLWNDEIAKKKLLENFDLLGFNDPNVIEARKKLSTLMFK